MMVGGIKTRQTANREFIMKKTVLLILLTSTNLALGNNLIREEYDAKPMIEGNRRVDELIEWNKLHPGQMPPLTEEEKYELFTKQGIPLPGSGATVVESNRKFTKEQSAIISSFNNAQKTKGYYEQPSKRAKFLLEMPEIAEKEYNERKHVIATPHDTHLRETLTDLPMLFSYKGVPINVTHKVIGYAPEHTFVDTGWTGAVEFFVPYFDSVCAYHEVNIQLTQTAAYIPKEIATNAVNKKLTKMNVVGDKETGFVYEVEWWDKKFKRTLECAAKDYSETMRKNTLELAKKIDRLNF